MQKKRKLLTKIGLFALAMTLLMNPLWAMAADNDAPEAVQQQENRSAVEAEEQLPEEQTLEAVPTKEQTSEVTPVESEIKDTKNFDVDGPVIDEIIFHQNGQTLQQSDTLKVGVRAHDEQSGIASITVEIHFSNHNYSDGHDWASITLKQNASDSNLYEGELPLEGTTLTNAYIQNIDALDNAGSRTKISDLYDPASGTYKYFVHIVPKRIEDIVVSDFSFSKKNTEVSEQDNVNVSFNITSNLDDSKGRFLLKFYQENSSTNERSDFTIDIDDTDPTNTFTSNIRWFSFPKYGKWVFDGLVYFEKGREFPVKGVNTTDTWFKLLDTRTDTEAPQIHSVSIDRNREFVTAGDTVTFTIQATDNVELASTALLRLRSAVDFDTYDEFYATYDEKEDAYKASYTISDTMYPCEWYLDFFGIFDIHGNVTNYNAYPTFPNYIKVKNGSTFVNPSYTVPVVFHALDENKDWTTYSWKNYTNLRLFTS